MDGLVAIVVKNLEDQHDWTDLGPVRVVSPGRDQEPALSIRTLLRGRPPHLLYLHPDDQKAALETTDATCQGPEEDQQQQLEWVLPVHITQKLTLAALASVFDFIPAPAQQNMGGRAGKTPHKRILLASAHPDSTIVYYFIHEGIVKPRQN